MAVYRVQVRELQCRQGKEGTPTPERRGRSPFAGASIEPASPGRQGSSMRRDAGGQGGSSVYDGGSPFLQPVTVGSPFLATTINSPSPSFTPTLLYSPSIAPTVARSPFELAPTTVGSPATSIALLPVQSPFASHKALSPARSPFEVAVSQSPGRVFSPARSPFEAAVRQSPGRNDTLAFEPRSRMESRQPRNNMDASGSPSKRQLDVGTVPSRFFVRPRRASSMAPVKEPLSNFPDQASPF